MNREYLNNDKIIDFKFVQNSEDFIVDEVPLGEFKGRGNYIILHVKKVELTTWDMIAAISKFLNIEAQKIGYAGLKDKHATTTQYISLDRKYENSFKKFKHKQIKILKIIKHTHSIRMGDLFANKFSINLFNVDKIKAGQIQKVSKKIEKNSMANYFGYQRFGQNEDSINQAKEMIKGDLYITDTKLKKFLISVYQSYYFNEWLKERILLSKEDNQNSFMLLEGDVYMSQDKKLLTPKKIPFNDFKNKKLIPTGLLCGRNVFRSRAKAREIEKKYDDEFLYDKGLRREAVVFPHVESFKYNEDKQMLNISFTLPKGSYATVFLENIANRNFSAKDAKSDLKFNK